jgi:uncharacterized protein
MGSIITRIRTWQRQIPKMDCLPGCHECCQGYAPSMTKFEWYQIHNRKKFSTGQTLQYCPFLGANGCTIYHRRPLICRLYGTVESQDAGRIGIFKAYCPRGARPDQPLAFSLALQIQSDYEGELWTQACKLIQQYIAYLKGPRERQLPLKFEYLRYLFSTKDGQRGLSLLMGIDRGEITAEQYHKIKELLEGDECQPTT